MRTTIFIAALAAAISSIASAASAADPFPKFDIAKNCKAEVAENTGIGETLESCTRDEQQAMQELMPQWDHYRREDKNVCMRETGLAELCRAANLPRDRRREAANEGQAIVSA